MGHVIYGRSIGVRAAEMHIMNMMPQRTLLHLLAIVHCLSNLHDTPFNVITEEQVNQTPFQF